MDFSNYTQKYALSTTQKFQNLIHKAVLLALFNKRCIGYYDMTSELIND